MAVDLAVVQFALFSSRLDKFRNDLFVLPVSIACQMQGQIVPRNLRRRPVFVVKVLCPTRGLSQIFDGVGNAYRVYSAAAWLMAVVLGSAAVIVRRRLEGRPPESKPPSS